MRQRFRPGIDFLGFWLDLSLFTARCPSHACFQEFFILLCPRLKTAKIDRFWFATFISFNKMASVEWVYLSLDLKRPLKRGVLNPLFLKKPGFLPNLGAARKYFAQKTRFLGPISKSKM